MSKKQLFSRLLQIIIVLVGISFITFFLTYLSPGDPVENMYISMGQMPPEEVVEQTREEMGLNDPFFTQYFRWLGNCLQGDFGTSYSLRQPVTELLLERVGSTLKLTAVISSNADFWSLFLPALSLAIAMASKYTRQVRAAVLEELNQDYVIGAQARGIRKSRIIWGNVFPNALLPLVTMLGLSVGSLLGGTSVVEIIFSYPGLGNLAVSAITSSDYNLIQGYVLWMALIYMVINLIVDASYVYIDPRMRIKRR